MKLLARMVRRCGVAKRVARRRGDRLRVERLEDRCVPSVTITEFAIPTAAGQPGGIAAGPDGNLWFTEFAGDKIGRITPAGKITEFSIPTANANPLGIASGPDGNLWFTESAGDKIGRITTNGSVTDFAIPTANANPTLITAGPDGNIWFTEQDGDKIGRITTAGAATEFAVPTPNAKPAGIAAGPDGNLWFTEFLGDQIGRITTSGTVTEFAISTAQAKPAGIVTGPDGNIWFTESGVNKIGRITTSGAVTEFPVPSANPNPAIIAAGPDSNLWFCEQTGGKIGRITTNGTVTEFAIPTSNSGPVGIAVGPDSNLWFTESNGDKIGQITSPPSALLTVVPPSFPTDTLHFHTLQDALANAVGAHDTIQIEPGADPGLFNSATLAAAANVGDTSITTSDPIAPSEIVSVGNQRDLIDAVATAAGSLYTLALHDPIANAQAAGTAVTNDNTIGIGNTVTIQGDPNVPSAPVSDLEVWSGTIQVTLLNLNVGRVTLDADTSGTQLIDSTVNVVVEAGGGTGNGLNLFNGNTVTANGLAKGLFNLTGNIPGTPNNDEILNNTFVGGARIILEDNDGTLVQGNTFAGQPANGVALSVDDSQHVVVRQNHFTLVGGSQDNALRVEFVTFATSATILNNVISTSGLGTGLFLNVGNGTKFEALVQGNDLRGNVLGVKIIGDSTSAGAIDLGGGSAGDLGTSLGGNNFRGYLSSATANGNFAIFLQDTGATATVSAQENIWSVADPTTVIKDGNHHTNIGGGNPGTGSINVGTTQLTPDQQFVQSLYNQFLRRSGSLPELNSWVGGLPSLGQKGVANAIIHSRESFKDLVDRYYLQYLGRAADPGGESHWIGVLQNGGTAEQVEVGFLSSPEYYNHATALVGSPYPDANFVQSLYEQLLGRPGSAVEIQGWLGQLPGLGRSGVASGILGSVEARSDMALELYVTLLHRPRRPSAAEIAYWAGTSFDLLTMETQMAATPEYYANG